MRILNRKQTLTYLNKKAVFRTLCKAAPKFPRKFTSDGSEFNKLMSDLGFSEPDQSAFESDYNVFQNQLEIL